MKEMKRILAMVLCLVMVVGMVPMTVFAEDAVIDAAIFASDVHGRDTNTDASSVTNVFTKIAEDADLAKASSANFVGDTQMAQDTVTSVAQTALGNTSLVCNYAFGSHDDEGGATIADVTDILYENDNYYVYAISQTDMENANNASTAASAFATKVDGLDSTKPMFILTHMPLHAGRNDNAGAASWFDAIQTAAASMDIVVFWGHNHTEENKENTTEEDRAAYYVAKDGTVALDVYNGTATVPGFTYMNAGYIGRTEEKVGRAGIATTVKLYADKMVFQDYNSSGAYSGDYAHNVTVNFEFANLSTDSGEGDSGSTVNTVSCDAGLYDTVTAIGTGLTKVTADVNERVDLTGFDEDVTAVYDVTLEGYTEGTEVTLVFDLYYQNSAGMKVYSVAEDGTLTEVAFTAEDKVDAEDENYYYSSFTVTTTSATGTYLIGKETVAEGAVMTGISVTSQPDITGYVLVKDADDDGKMYLDITGLVVTATYDNGQTDVLNWNQFDETKDGYVLGDFDLYTPGTETITITYGEFTTSFDVIVYEKTVADVSSDETVAAAVASVLKEGYVAQDIDLAGYTQGDLVKVAMNVPANANKVYHVAEDGILTEITNAEFNNGVATFITDHFSTYAAGEERVDVWEWITMPSTSYILDEDGVDAGGQYLIVAPDSAYAMKNSISSNAADSYGVEISSDGKTITVDSDLASYLWTFSGSTSGTIKNGSNYLRRGDKTALSLNSSQSTTWTISSNDDGTYRIYSSGKQNSYYLRYSSSSFSLSTSTNSNTVRLYKYTEGDGGVAGIAGASEYTVDLNTTADAALAAVKAGITGYYGATSEAAEALDDSALTWTWVDTYDGETADSYTVAISYNGTQLGTVEVKVVERQATSIEADEMSGSVRINSGTSATTGTKLAVIYEDNTTATVDVTVGMLTDADGNPVSTATQGTYKNLIINYGGQKITGYTLVVNPVGGDNYPEYPKEGAVRVNKVSDGAETNFQSTGVVKVELSTTGVPYEGTGADIILCLDWTNSMDEVISGSTTRKVATANATRAFLKTILLDDEGNLNTQTRILIYGFEGGNAWHVRLTGGTVNEFETITMENLEDYQTGSLTTAELLDDFLEDKIEVVYNSSTKKYTTDTIGGAESSSTTISVSKTVSNGREVSDGGTSGQSGGTTYGEPLAAVYEKFAATTYESGQEKSQFCVFMSDGAPTALDYYGIVTESQDATTGAWTYTYDIYGSTNVVSWLSGSDSAGYTTKIREELWSAKGRRELGVTYFSVGLGINSVDGVSGYKDNLSDTGYYTIASALLESIATDPSGNLTQTFFPVTDTAAGDGGLATAFEKIASSIKQAGTNAYFVDTMGDNFDLQMNTTLTNDLGSTTTIPSTDITVTQYTLIKRSQIGQTVSLNGVDTVITEEHVGIRTGESSVLETVSFKVANDGTVTAYSSVIGSTTNILVDGVIYAKNFFYNTTAADVKIDTDGDGTTDYTLPAETFYWNIGTISESEVALSYYVYLDGALDGEREAGDAYNTNKSATLYYTNYLGNSAYKDTVSPVVAWQSAVVSYAFYLVDADTGLPITNITTGATGSFNDSVKVTIPTVYKTVMLNSEESIHSILASDVLLEGYELFDPAAKYSIKLDTVNENVSGWEIVKGTDRATTYVTSYGGEPTTDLIKSGSGADYTNTVVYFAVKFQIQTINDAVVVDYGLPVDITVMGNDFFGNNGKLVAVGTAIPDDIDGDSETSNDDIGTGNFSTSNAFVDASNNPVTSVDTTYGSAEVNVTSEDSYFDGYVRYTPDTMNFVGVDKVAYCVKYTDPDPEDTNFGDVTGYYYGEISVIPATTVYYEDNFTTSDGGSYITYTGYSRASKDDDYAVNDKLWETEKEENAPTDVTQAEDRPGQYSSTYIDANNVYGYDAAYDNMTTWSMGSAKKIHVDANQYGTAEFTFNGTGFDVISMTDSTTGTLAIQVYDANNNRVKSLVVDTYYGYQYTNGEWVKTDTAGEGIMQVPVMQISELPYGQYTVKITALYYAATDQTSADGYDLYLDAIRIYDPINTSTVVSDRGTTDTDDDITVETVYKQDEEGWPIYQELRNNVIESAIVSGETNGIVFVDGVGDTAAVSNYTNYGPNNELYLAPGQAIGFNLDLSAFETYDSEGNLTKNTVAAVQLGIKSADGNPVTYKIFDAATVSEAADLANIAVATVNTATDMYYDIYSLRHKTIVIANTGNSGILSLTDIKLTFTETPPAVSNLLYVTGETVGLVLKATTEVEKYFSPATFNVTCTNSAFVGNRVNVNVETSSDVAAITVNGVKYTKYYQNKATGKRYWAAKVDAAEAGDYEIVVVAYDAEGTPSDPATHTIEFTVPDSGNINISGIKDVVNKILGWLKG